MKHFLKEGWLSLVNMSGVTSMVFDCNKLNRIRDIPVIPIPLTRRQHWQQPWMYSNVLPKKSSWRDHVVHLRSSAFRKSLNKRGISDKLPTNDTHLCMNLTWSYLAFAKWTQTSWTLLRIAGGTKCFGKAHFWRGPIFWRAKTPKYMIWNVQWFHP